MSAARALYLSPADYLAIERKADRRSEYYHGEMFAMAGNTIAHIRIVTNLTAIASTILRDKPCDVLSNEMRVQVLEDVYCYPDIVVACGDPHFVDNQFDTLTNPIIVVEVLSKTTESYDRGKKFASYRGIPSLKQYILVSQFEPYIEWYIRQTDEHWLLTDARGMDAMLPLPSLDCSLPLAEIYRKIVFKPEQ